MLIDVILFDIPLARGIITAEEKPNTYDLLVTYKIILMELSRRKLLVGSRSIEIRQGSKEWIYKNKQGQEQFFRDIRDIQSMSLVCSFSDERSRTMHGGAITKYKWRYSELNPFDWDMEISFPSPLPEFLLEQSTGRTDWIDTELFPDIPQLSRQPSSRPLWAEQLIIRPLPGI